MKSVIRKAYLLIPTLLLSACGGGEPATEPTEQQVVLSPSDLNYLGRLKDRALSAINDDRSNGLQRAL